MNERTGNPTRPGPPGFEPILRIDSPFSRRLMSPPIRLWMGWLNSPYPLPPEMVARVKTANVAA